MHFLRKVHKFKKCKDFTISIYVIINNFTEIPFLYQNKFTYCHDENYNYYIILHLYISSNVNEAIKTILDFFTQKQLFKRSEETSFWLYRSKYYYWRSGNTIPYCSLVAFCAFTWSLCFWCFWCVQNLFVKENKEFKTALRLSGQFSASVFFFTKRYYTQKKAHKQKSTNKTKIN